MAAEFRPLSGAIAWAKLLRPDAPFIVVTMFTTNLRAYADRLKASLERLGLSFVLYEVPTIHSSVSASGTSDLAFCKPNVIHASLEEFRVPVLYVDADFVFREAPRKVPQLISDRIDFAIYNWLADTMTDAYMPVTVTLNGVSFENRFYRFSHSVDLYDPTQLLASGGSQFYTRNAAPLLRGWLDAISRFPQARDDELLDYTYNYSVGADAIRSLWWTKDYCRIAYWITVKPVIDHPQIPGGSTPLLFSAVSGIQPFRVENVGSRVSPGPFPRDCLIDAQERCLLRIDNRGQASLVGRFDKELWLGNR